MKRKIAVGNLGEEELAQLKWKVMTRADTRAEADLLFNHKATEIAAQNQKRLKQLFVQAPATETMAPTLAAKTAAVRSFEKLAYIFGAAPESSAVHAAIPYKTRRKGHEKYLNKKSKEKPTGYGKAGLVGAGIGGLAGAALGHGYGSASAGALGGAAAGGLTGLLLAGADKHSIRSAKKAVKSKGGVDRHLAEHINTVETAKDWEATRRHHELMSELRSQRYKYSSATAVVDAFFDKVAKAQLSDAQRRYPELLKASAAPGGAGTVKTTPTKRGPCTPAVRSSLSGGAA